MRCYSVLPKIIGQGSVLFGVEALAYLRGHWGVCLVHRKTFGWATVGSIEDQRGVRHGTQLTLSSLRATVKKQGTFEGDRLDC